MSVIFADTRSMSVRLRGKSQHLEETKKLVNNILQKEKEFLCNPEYVKQTKGVKDYLMILSDMKEVQCPSYWSGKASQCDQQPLNRQSEVYREVEKMVQDTWEASKAGHGNDARGLKHTKLVIKQISLIENRSRFAMYDAMRKQVCMEAAINQFPSLNGLKGEMEVKTRTLGRSPFHMYWAAVFYVFCIKYHVCDFTLH